MPYRIVSPITHSRIGFRGGVLLIYGVLEMIVGWAIFVTPASPFAPHTAFNYAPMAVYGFIWLIPGIVAFIAAFFDGAMETFGYAMSFMPFFLFGLGDLIDGWPLGITPIGTALRGTAIFWAFALLIILIVRWPEPKEVADSTFLDMIQQSNELADVLKNGGANDDAHGDDSSPTPS